MRRQPDDPDYYAVLGVPTDTTTAETSRAFGASGPPRHR
jgi:curved DNA-binding protein CbpA